MHPILFHWGPVTLYSYGVLLALGVLLAVRLASRRAGALGTTPARTADFVIWVVLGGLLGARVVYVLQNWPVYAGTPLEIFRLDHGGLVFYGGLLGGFVTAGLLIRRWRWPLVATLGFFIPYGALAQAIGRLGCFFNGCCYGKPTTLPWAVRFPGETVARHPTQLYEAAALFLLYGVLRRVHATRPSAVIGIYFLGYGGWRFLIEFLRGDNPAVIGPLTFSQVVSVPCVLLGLWLISRRAA